MGLLFGDDDEEEEEELTDEEEEQLNLTAGFESAKWTNFAAVRLIDWEAEVVLYYFGHTEPVVSTNDLDQIEAWGGGGYDGLTAVPLDNTDIDPSDYDDPRGTTQEEL